VMKVGNKVPKEVTKLNNALFLKAKDVMEEASGEFSGSWHYGNQGISAFIDWLENNYEIKLKEEHGNK